MGNCHSKMCSGCQRKNQDNNCLVIEDPQYVFDKYGKCWAWTDDKHWEERVEQLTRNYALRTGQKWL